MSYKERQSLPKINQLRYDSFSQKYQGTLGQILSAFVGIDLSLFLLHHPLSENQSMLKEQLSGIHTSFRMSKKEGKDQEMIQSSTTPDPGYQWESDHFTIRRHKREPRGQSFPSR